MQYKITLHVLHLLENVKKFEICYTICNIIQMNEINLYIAYIFLLHLLCLCFISQGYMYHWPSSQIMT
jgi:hypothetical protein